MLKLSLFDLKNKYNFYFKFFYLYNLKNEKRGKNNFFILGGFIIPFLREEEF